MIAIVDDDRSIRTSLARLMRSAGYEARAFASSGDRRQVSLGPVPRPVDAMTIGPATTLVGLD
jgi:DNA-binding response OmpR family regulator